MCIYIYITLQYIHHYLVFAKLKIPQQTNMAHTL